MAKKAGPPLYDVIRSGSLGRSPDETGGHEPAPRQYVEAQGRPAGPPVGPPVESWLQPGRTVAVPAGYLFVAAAVVVLLAIGGYMIGYNRGKHDERIAYAEYLDPALGGVGHVLPRDPLEIPASRRDESYLAANSRAASQTRPSTSPWGDVRSDPRQEGLWYFILVTTNESGALRLAEYCRERGLEAYAVQTARGRLWQVIALPGLASRTDPQATALRQQINRIGETWQRHERGATNLHDAYPERFGG